MRYKSKQKNFRVVFSFREEYLPQFESLRKEIPSIRFTNSRYRLEPFSVSTAKTIIVKTAPAISDDTALNVSENIAMQIEGFDEKRVDPFLLSLICQIIYPDLLQQNSTSSEESKLKIKSLVDNAIESYVTKVYKTINEETKKFIEKKLITSDGKKNSVNYNEVASNAKLKSDIEKLVEDPNYRLLSIGQFLDSNHVSILHDRLLPPLIKRKEERKAKEDLDAFIERQQELKKKKKAVLIYFFSGLILLTAFLSFTVVQKHKSRKLIVMAASAKHQADMAIHQADSVKRQADTAKRQADTAKRQADTAKHQAVLAKQKADAAIKRDSVLQSKYQTQQELTALLQESVDSNYVSNDLRTINISYTLNNSLLSADIFDSLFQLKNKHLDNQYHQLFNSIQNAINAKQEVLNGTNSLEGFIHAKKLWEKNKGNPIIESILFSFINKPVYFKQITTLYDNNNNLFFNRSKPMLAFSNLQNESASQNFAFNFGDSIYAGNFNASLDTITIQSSAMLFAVRPGYSAVYDSSFSSYYNTPVYNDTAVLNSLVFYNDTITGLINDSLFAYKPGEKNISNKKAIPVGKYSGAILSPNAKYLITYNAFDSIFFWNINTEGASKKIFVKTQPAGIKSIIFSRNSNRFLILGLYGDIDIYTIDLFAQKNIVQIDNKSNTKYSYDKIQAANFTNDGRSLIAAGNYFLYLRDRLDASDTLHPVCRMPYNYYYSAIKSISLSSDAKKLLIETPDAVIVCKNINEDSDLISNQQTQHLTYKNVSAGNNSKAVSLLNSNSIISISDSGNLYLLKIYPEFKSLNEAFNTIKQPPLPLSDQFKLNPGDTALYQKILASNDERTIRSAAQYYAANSFSFQNNSYNESNLFKSIELYRKLISIQKNDIASVIELINRIKDLSASDTSMKNKEAYYKEIVSLTEKYNTPLSKDELSINYGNLAFYSFFSGNFNNGLQYALKGIELDSTKDFIYTNKALGYLLTKQFDSAEAVYNKYKDSFNRTNYEPFKDSFKKDLIDLEAYGIINKNDDVIYEEVKKIKRNILKLEER